MIAAALAWAATAAAAPAADLVVFHAPDRAAGPAVNAVRDALAAVARRRGAAWIDASPTAPPPPATAQAIAEAQRAYDQLQFDAAVSALDRAAAELERTGAAGLDPRGLADLFLYRGLVRVQLGDARAWDDLVEAAALDPGRALDPARLPPRAIEAYGRAADAVRAAPRATLTVRVPDRATGCEIAIDAARATDGKAEVATGRHFVLVRCPGHQPWASAITTAAGAATVDAAPVREAPPGDDELAIQARTAGAHALVAVSVSGAPAIATLRRMGVDGKVDDRATVATGGAHAAEDAAAALDRLLAPPVTIAPERWYEKRWVWAAAGAGVAAAVLVPILLVDRGSPAATKATLEPSGLPW